MGWLKFWLGVVSGTLALIATVLLVYFGPNLLYAFRGRFSGQPLTGRPPTKKPRQMWVLFWICIFCAILTAAIKDALPDPLPASQFITPTVLETPTPTYTLTSLKETPTVYPTYTPTSTATWTPSATPSEIPSDTPSPTRTITSTPLAPENFGGLVYDCIPDRHWDLKPTSNVQLANGCFLLGDWGLHADYRRLNIILPSQKVRDNLVNDLFLPVSGNVDISFTVTVEQFKGSGGTHAAPLFSVGICNQHDAEKRGNFVLYSYRDDGSILWGIVSDSFDRFEKNYRYTLDTAQDFVIQIRSYDLTIYGPNSMDPVWSKTVAPEDLTAFCVHYTLPTLGELTATIDNFLVVSK